MNRQQVTKMTAGVALAAFLPVLRAEAQTADSVVAAIIRQEKHSKTIKADSNILEFPLRLASWQRAQQSASLEQVLRIDKKKDSTINDNNTASFHLSLIDENSQSIVDLVANREKGDAFSLRGHIQYHGSNGEKNGNPEIPESNVHFTGTLPLQEMKKLLKSVVEQTERYPDGINAETRHLLQLATESMPVPPSDIIPVPFIP